MYIPANLRTNIMDFRGFDSSIIFIIRGGIPRPMGDFPESLSQEILVGIMLVGRLGVPCLSGWRVQLSGGLSRLLPLRFDDMFGLWALIQGEPLV